MSVLAPMDTPTTPVTAPNDNSKPAAGMSGAKQTSADAMKVLAGAGYVRVIIPLPHFIPEPDEPTSRPGVFDERLSPDAARRWAAATEAEHGDPDGFAAALRAGADYAERAAAEQVEQTAVQGGASILGVDGGSAGPRH